MKNSLYAVLRWLENKADGEIALDLLGLFPVLDEAKQVLSADEESHFDELDENDAEFEAGSLLGLEYLRDSQHDQYRTIVEVEPAAWKKAVGPLEYQWICEFVATAFFGQETDRNHLLSLWTAYCLHHNLDVDTKMYDTMAAVLWKTVDANNTGPWKTFEAFDFFLSQYLV